MSSSEGSAARRLDLLRLSQRPDPELQSVIMLGSYGLSLAVGMIVGNSLVRGAVAPRTRFAAALDEALLALANASKGTLHLGEPLKGMFLRDAESADRKRQEGWDVLASQEKGVSVDDLDDTQFPATLPALVPARTLVLTDAKIHIDGSWTTVGQLQVNVDHVAAWWLLDDEAGLSVDYHFSPSDEAPTNS